MPINIKILSHIALIDLEGRFGLQGGNFVEFANFLKVYLQVRIPVDETLLGIIDEMIRNCERINELYSNTNYEKLNNLALKFQNEIHQLQVHQSFYLPGGWINVDSNSHSIIYEFKRINERQLQFIIYNGGAGLELHDEIADLESEKRMPVKIYNISFEKTRGIDFNNFIKRLIEPQIVHAPWRKEEYFTYNANLLYHEIQFIIHLLEGTIIDSRSVLNKSLAGAGITSGTCSQATIQQFLKVYLNDISKYQKFMVHYKIYTIESYLQSIPVPQPKILELINKALINIQRIIDIKGLFSEEEAELMNECLESMKCPLLKPPPKTEQSTPIILPKTPQISNIQHEVIKFEQPTPQISILMEDTSLDLIEKLRQFDISINQDSEKYSLSNMNKTEYVNRKIAEFWEIPFITLNQYKGLETSPFEGHSKSQLQKMIVCLSSIIREISSGYFHEIMETEVIAMRWSLLTLLDHIYKKLNIDYKIWGALSTHIQAFYQYKGFLVSSDPKINSRLETIIQIYTPKQFNITDEELIDEAHAEIKRLIIDTKEKLKENQKKDEWRMMQYYCNFEIMTQAQAILSQNSTVQALFESLYHKNYPAPPVEHVFIKKHALTALYALVNIIIPNLKKDPISPNTSYINKTTLAELKSDFQGKYALIDGLFITNDIEKKFLDYLVIVEHFDIDEKINLFDFKDLSTYQKILNPKLEWVRTNLHDPKVQNNKQHFALFVLLYIELKSNANINSISRDSLIKHLNLYLKNNHILFQNIGFLIQNNIIQLVEKLYLQKLFDINISSVVLDKRLYAIRSLPFFIFDENQILTMDFETLKRDLGSRFLRYDNPLFRIGLLKQWSDVFGDKNIFLHFKFEDSNQIECSSQTQFIKALKYIHKTNDCSLILLIEFFSQEKNLMLLLNEKDYQDYFLIRLFNARLITSTIKNHSTKLIESIHELVQRVYQFSEHQWTPKNEFILRVKCYLICYMYLTNHSEFHDEFVQFQREIQSLNDSSNRKYCEFYMLATQIIAREDIDFSYLESINERLIEENWVFSDNMCPAENELLKIIENKLKYLLCTSNSRKILYSPCCYSSIKLIDVVPFNIIRDEFKLSYFTPCIPIGDNLYKVLSRPNHLIIQMNEMGILQSISKNNQVWISIDDIPDLPEILKKDGVLIWQDKDDPSQIILERQNQPFLKVIPEGLFTLEEPPGQLKYGEIDHYLHQFEDLGYVLSFQYQDGSAISYMERYQFSFRKEAHGQIIFLNQPHYHLIQNASPFAPEVACLVMEDHEANRQCFVPIQNFYINFINPDLIATGDYLPITHNLQSTQHDYANFKLIDGQPIAKNTRDSLYLVYIYMATHEYQKANTILKKIIKDNCFTGSSQEFKILEMILKDCLVKENYHSTKQVLNFQYDVANQLSAEESACKLRTFVILGLWQLQGHSIDKFSNNNYFLTYHYYKIFKKELRSEFILSHAELRGLFSLYSKDSYTYLLYDKAKSHIFHLQRLKQTCDDAKYHEFIDKRIQDVKRISEIKSKYISNEIKLTFPRLDNLAPITLQFDEAMLSDITRPIKLHFNLKEEELQHNFTKYIRYFMNEPLKRDIDFLKYFLIQRQGYSNSDKRYPLMMLLYLLYCEKEKFPYRKLRETIETVHDIWGHFNSLRNIKISVPDLKLERYSYPPYISNQDISADIRRFIPISYPTQNELSTVGIFEKPIASQEALLIVESSLPDLNKEEIAWIKFENRKKFETIGQAFIETLHREEELNKYQQMKTDIEMEIDNKWVLVLNLANSLNSKLKRKAYMYGQIQSVSKSDLMNCYIRQDLNEYMTICLINKDEAQAIHQLIHNAMHLELEKQWISHYLSLLNNEIMDAVAILEHICKNPSKNFSPPLMNLQFNLGILLMPNQLKVIEHIIHPSANPYELISLPMGSGKTKILLPYLANYFANGKQLSLVEAPQSLLETTYQDLKIFCLQHFDKNVYLFTFERWKNISKENLKFIYEHFESVILNKEIIMSSPESIQSLILQYIELLILNPQTYQEEIQYLGQIIHIFQTRTYAILDEAHHILSPHTVHNFSLGKKVQISHRHIGWMLDLHQFIYTKKLNDAQSIILELIRDENSPLYKQVSPNIIQYLSSYFKGEKETDALIHLHATSNEQEILAFYKLQLVSLNPESLSLFDKVKQFKLYVDYGPSRIETSALKSNIAIPYESHNTPLEHSEFSLHWITMHCTIQMLYERGLNQNIFKEFLTEALNDLSIQRKLTPLLQSVGTNFKWVSIDNDNQIKLIFEQIMVIPELYQRLTNLILEKSLLTKIEIDTSSISQNSFQHLGSMCHVLAVTGTIGETFYYSPDLIINDELSRGNQEYLITLLQQKATIVHRCDEKNIINLLRELEAQSIIQANFSAIIDINAHFNGITNEQAALSICEFLQLQYSEKTHVLYFNQHNQLCAMSVKEAHSINVIGPTSLQEIQKVLPDIHPDDYFVYYDQSHSFGIDIVLPSHAFALVLTDEKHDFSQGCTRLRGLEKNQSLTLIVPTHTNAENIQELSANIQAYEKNMLQQSIIPLTMKKFDNIIYQKILRKIVASPSEFKKVENFFLQIKSFGSLYENDIRQKTVQPISFLEKYYKNLLIQYQGIFRTEGLQELKDKMIQIMRKLPFESLPSTYCISSEPTINERTSNLGVQLQKSQQITHSNLIEQDYTKQASRELPPLPLQSSNDVRTLNTWFNHYIFSRDIYASTAFMQTYEGQKFSNLLALKPAFLIQFSKPITSDIHAKIICVEEYHPSQNPSLWYTSAAGFIIDGTPDPKWLDSQKVKNIIEQIHFYNGDFGWLEEHIHALNWLLQQTEEKIMFFKSTLMKLRETQEYLVDDVYAAIIERKEKLGLNNMITLHHIQSLDINFIKEIEEFMLEFYLSPDLHEPEKIDYLLRFIILKSIDQCPKIDSYFMSFFTPVTDKSIIDIIQTPHKLDQDQMHTIKKYIKSRDPNFAEILNHEIEKLGLQVKTFDALVERIISKSEGPSLG